MINQEIGNYKFLSVLGEGGMAVVYLAENTMLDCLVAVKVLKHEFVHNKNIRTRFLDEAKKMAKVKHPNIILVMDLIAVDDTVAIVMEYAEGKSLKDFIERIGKLDDATVESFLFQMLLSLQHIHQSGYIHRDIKPSNFMLGKDGTIKLADFGIAKDKNAVGATETGTQMGTPVYMSPEQVKADKTIDHRSDIYSLGVTLYYAINGKPPYDGNTTSQFDIHKKIVEEPLPDGMGESHFIEQINKACAKDREMRFQSCGEWLEVLQKGPVNKVVVDKTVVVTDNDKTVIVPSKRRFEEQKSEVIIGAQVWLTKNLDVATFRNGDPIQEAKTNAEWLAAGTNKQPAWCYYENESTNSTKYGKLYNWYAVNDPRGLAPEGYHVPTDEEWTQLTDYLGGESVAGTKMKSTSGWYANGNGTNESGFNGLPGGGRLYNGTFYSQGSYGYWWSASDEDKEVASFLSLYYNYSFVGRNGSLKEEGYSVRCLKD